MNTKSGNLTSIRIRSLGVEIIVKCNSPQVLKKIHQSFSLPTAQNAVSRPLEVLIREEGDLLKVLFEDREETLRRAQRWPQTDDLIQLIVQRERPDLAFVHGACVSSPKGAVLLFGSSTAGKTTLALALAQAGFALLGDDTTPVSLISGMAYPFRSSVHLRPYTAQLAEQQDWSCSGQDSTLTPAPLNCIVYVTPKTTSRTSHIRRVDYDQWERLLRLTGLPPQRENPHANLPVRTQADFNCNPELAPIRQSNIVRELLRHSHVSQNLKLPDVFQSMTRLVKHARIAQLTPGYLAKTVQLIRDWTLH